MGSETFASNVSLSENNEEELELSLDLSHLPSDVGSHSKATSNHDNHSPATVENFYDEVDQRMSRNSLEYPNHQALYVDRWLESDELQPEGTLDRSLSNCGNVVGIRGVDRADIGNQDGRKRNSPNYKKLEFDYLRLKSQYNELKGSIHGNILKFYKSTSRRRAEEELAAEDEASRREQLGARVNLGSVDSKLADYNSLNKRMRQINLNHEQELRSLRDEVSNLKAQIHLDRSENESALKKLTLENERLKASLNRTEIEREKEVCSLKEQLQGLTSKAASNKTLIKLSDENNRLRDLKELDDIELGALKEKYIRLEAQLSSVLEEERRLEEEKSKEVSSLMVELCRLQVHLPKVELLLETERAIKEELQRKLELVDGENERLRAEVGNLNAAASHERMRALRLETAEIESLRNELEDWREKCCRLKREKADADDLLRGARANASILDARHQSRLDAAEEQHKLELDNMRKSVVSLEENVMELKAKNSKLTGQLRDDELERQRLGGELVELGVKLDNLRHAETRMREQEKLADGLRGQLSGLEAEARRSAAGLREAEMELDRHKEQINELQRRHECQLRAFEELRERKDKEVSELRVKLNLERYNKQVAMESIEKELRVSLKELELMKYRFSRRLLQSEPPLGLDRSAPRSGAATRPCPEPKLVPDSKQQMPQDSGKEPGAARLISAPVRGGEAPR